MTTKSPVVLVALCCLSGCGQADSLVDHHRNRSTDEKIDMIKQSLKSAQGAKYAMIFVHVDWAPMSIQREFFEKLVRAYTQREQRRDVRFYYVDFTPVSDSYDPLPSWEGWREFQERRNGSPLGGGGELIWVRQGRILEIKSTLHFSTVNEAIELTEKTFSEA